MLMQEERNWSLNTAKMSAAPVEHRNQRKH